MNSPSILQLIEKEHTRQTEGMELIPSENYVSKDVLTALGSVLTNKYSEGYPGARYYGGQDVIDEIENAAIENCQKLFGFEYVNVQSYSGSPANLSVLNGLLEPGDLMLTMALDMGGHLSHGYKITLPGRIYQTINYGVISEKEISQISPMSQIGRINYDEVEKLAKEHHPKLIIAGGSAYSRIIDFERFSKIAKSVDAYLMTDIAHIAGLIAGGAHPSPKGYADVVTSTTHKTLRGPRGGLIMTDSEDLKKKIWNKVFPGIQGGPHDNNTAAKAICFAEALKPSFKTYAKQVVKNAQVLAKTLQASNKTNSTNTPIVISGGTDNHLMMVDVTPLGITGKEAQVLLDTVGITVNKQMIPRDPRKPADPSGIRLGSPAMTTRGFKEKEFTQTANWILETLKNPSNLNLHKKIHMEVRTLCKNHPLPSDR